MNIWGLLLAALLGGIIVYGSECFGRGFLKKITDRRKAAKAETLRNSYLARRERDRRRTGIT